jgi:diacylglycerol kinase family enzyme
VRVCEDVAIDDGTLALGVLKRAAQRDMPTLISRIFSEKRSAAQHRQIEHFAHIGGATISSISETKDGVTRPFPVQVDGDYIGERTELELKVDSGALTVIA